MSTSLEFFIAAIPSPKGNSKSLLKFGNRMLLVGNAKEREKETTLVALLQPHAQPIPWDCPTRLDITFVMPIPKSFTGWKREAALAGAIRPGKRPDRGNLLKLIEDVLEKAQFVRDDALIVAGDVAKAYGEQAGYRIKLTKLPEPTREEWASGEWNARK